MSRPYVSVFFALVLLSLIIAESDAIDRRGERGVTHECRKTTNRDWGVLFSGGGIRATAVAYSAIEALQETTIWHDSRKSKKTMRAFDKVHTAVGISGGSWGLVTAMANDYDMKKIDRLVEKSFRETGSWGDFKKFVGTWIGSKHMRCGSSKCHINWVKSLKNTVFPGFIPAVNFWRDSYMKKVEDCEAPNAAIAFGVWDCSNTHVTRTSRKQVIPNPMKDSMCHTLGYCHVTDPTVKAGRDVDPIMRCNDFRKEVSPAMKSTKAKGWGKVVPVTSLGNQRDPAEKHLDPLDVWELMGYSSSAWSAVNTSPSVQKKKNDSTYHQNPVAAHEQEDDVKVNLTQSNSKPHPVYPLNEKGEGVYLGIEHIERDADKGLLLTDEGAFCNLGFHSLFTPDSLSDYEDIIAFDGGDNRKDANDKDEADPLGVEFFKCLKYHNIKVDSHKKMPKKIHDYMWHLFGDDSKKAEEVFENLIEPYVKDGVFRICGSMDRFDGDKGTFTFEHCNQDFRNLALAIAYSEGNEILFIPLRGSDNVYIPDEFGTTAGTFHYPNFFERFEQYTHMRRRLKEFYKLAFCLSGLGHGDDACRKNYKWRVNNDTKLKKATNRFKPSSK